MQSVDDINFVKWLINNGYFKPLFTIDFNSINWEQINFDIQTQLSANELYKLSNEYYN